MTHIQDEPDDNSHIAFNNQTRYMRCTVCDQTVFIDTLKNITIKKLSDTAVDFIVSHRECGYKYKYVDVQNRT